MGGKDKNGSESINNVNKDNTFQTFTEAEKQYNSMREMWDHSRIFPRWGKH